MQICENIKQARISRGLTQSEMAMKLDLKNLTTYQNWEYNTPPSLEMINKIGKAIGVAPISLLSGVIDFTEQDVAQAVEQLNSDKRNDTLINLARLTSAIGRLVGLHEEKIFDTVQSFALGKTEVVVSERLGGNKGGKKKSNGN